MGFYILGFYILGAYILGLWRDFMGAYIME
jgi:hypothetical protein